MSFERDRPPRARNRRMVRRRLVQTGRSRSRHSEQACLRMSPWDHAGWTAYHAKPSDPTAKRLFHASEAQIVRAGAGLALAARADHVARAVLIGAEKRSAALHFL